MEVDIKPSVSGNLDPCTSSSGSDSKLGLCEVCAFHDAKYTCPRCEVKTCSLKCNKIHKLELECDGRRDRAKFIPINKFTNLDLSSDYRLLEEIARNVEASKKNFGRRFQDIPGHLLKLKNAAKSRRTTLMFLPYKFVRHQSNTTRLMFKTDTICWHIEWVFADANNLKLSDAKVDENTRLSSIFSKYLIEQRDACLQESLQYYQAAGISGIKFFLKAEQKRGKKFYELDPTLSLRECLQKKLIIEYPTIHVVLKHHDYGYDVIDSDDEQNGNEDDKVKSGNQVVETILKNAESDESLYSSMKNLLFVSEYSDEELSSDGNN